MSITRTLLKLQLILWWRSVSTQAVMLLLSLLQAGSLILTTLAFGFFSYFSLVEDKNITVFISVMALGTLVYLFAAFVLPTGESQPDLSVFAPLPLTAKHIFPGYTIALFLQTRSITATINTIIMMVMGALGFSHVHGALAALLWCLGCIVQLVITVLLGETLAATLTTSIGSGKRETLNLILGVVFIVIILGGAFLSNVGISTGAQNVMSMALSGVKTIGEWTPLAIAVATAAHLPQTPVLGVAMLILTVIYVAAIFYLWKEYLRRGLTQVLSEGKDSGRDAKNSSLLLPSLPATTRGALYSRYIRYLVRDKRLLYSMLVYPLAIIFYIGVGLSASDVGHFAWIGCYFSSVFAFLMISNTLGFDGPSNWVHMSAGIRARDLLQTRARVLIVINTIAIVVFTSIVGAFKGFNVVWGINTFMALCIMFFSTALGCYLAVKFPEPTNKPGSNLFKARRSKNLASLLGLVLIIAFSLPAIALLIFGYKLDSSALLWAGLGAELIITICVSFFAMRMAATALDTSWHRVFARVKNYN
ncbi:hypothetical protein EML15_09985 [Corynebacterium sp. sy017]|uniref:hypothetical protein n=1 Tax=unclassified Corynebacterium TaxID=2624378 RepID=UPI0011868CA2|nr:MULTISPECIES: hypothetical protein [unclassified Corynebacterium]MBP3089465.1 hypothetical protein [Corynebacterium sp. sy017]TSD90854.1 hypothetical protein ELY17_08615 [Corynebacterium sp. SY003]